MTAKPFPDVTLVITSCGRYDLLRRTLASMEPWLARFPNRILVEDGPGEEAEIASLRSRGFKVLVNGRNRGQHVAIDRAYAKVRTPFIFHVEDDWEFLREPDIATAAAILEDGIDGYRRISCVSFANLTILPYAGRLPETFRDVAVNSSRYRYSLEQKIPHNAFVFGACLLRRDLTKVTGPYIDFKSEAAIGRKLHRLGYVTVREVPGVIRHLGEKRHISRKPAAPPFIMRGKRFIRKAMRWSVRSIRMPLLNRAKRHRVHAQYSIPSQHIRKNGPREQCYAESPNNLSGPGANKKTLEAIEKAVAVRREQAEAQPDTPCPGLAENLHNLSNCLAALGGRREDALKAIEEAVAIRRQLAEVQPDAFRPGLASSLHDLSIRQSALRREKEALEAIEEAVAVRRGLAEIRPDAFRPDLARSLDNLAYCRFEFREPAEMLAAAQEAATIWRELACPAPAHGPPPLHPFSLNLARSLHNLSGCLSRLGRNKESVEAVEEAVAVLRSLASARPDAFRPDLVRGLQHLHGCLLRLGRKEEALEIKKEFVAICSGNS